MFCLGLSRPVVLGAEHASAMQILLNQRGLGPPPEFLIQGAWGGPRKFHLHVAAAIAAVWRPYFENPRSR